MSWPTAIAACLRVWERFMRRAQAGGESGEGEVASAAVAPPMEPMVELPPVASKATLPPALKLSFTPPATLEADRRRGDIASLPPPRAQPPRPDATPPPPAWPPKDRHTARQG